MKEMAHLHVGPKHNIYFCRQCNNEKIKIYYHRLVTDLY